MQTAEALTALEKQDVAQDASFWPHEAIKDGRLPADFITVISEYYQHVLAISKYQASLTL